MITSSSPDEADLRYQSLPRRVRRRLTLFALVRSVLASSALIVLYYLLPLDIRSAAELGVDLILGLAVFVLIVGVQAWRITRSDFPRLRAVEALASALPLFLLLFAATYFILSQTRVESFSGPLSRTGALYYTITVFATVGFGDIVPATEPARVVTMIQMLADLLVYGVVVRVLAGAVGVGLRRKATSETAPDPGQA